MELSHFWNLRVKKIKLLLSDTYKEIMELMLQELRIMAETNCESPGLSVIELQFMLG